MIKRLFHALLIKLGLGLYFEPERLSYAEYTAVEDFEREYFDNFIQNDISHSVLGLTAG